jgi:hypothetical protein
MTDDFYKYVLDLSEKVQEDFQCENQKEALKIALQIMNAESLDLIASEFSQEREGWMNIVFTDISMQLEDLCKILKNK